MVIPMRPSYDLEVFSKLSKPETASVIAKYKEYVNLCLPYDANSKRRVALTLVDLCTSFMLSIWPEQTYSLPLRRFVFEILRRSRVQYPVFQVALCYVARVSTHVTDYRQRFGKYPPNFGCGRKILIAALQVASKFLQDKFYSASSWARISGLSTHVLQENEIALMKALNWDMFVSYEAYMRCCQQLRTSMDFKYTKEDVVENQVPKEVLTPDSSPVYSLGKDSEPECMDIRDILNPDAFLCRSEEGVPN